MQVLVQLAEKGDKRDARFDRSKIGFHPNVAEAKASAIAVCCGSTGFTFPNRESEKSSRFAAQPAL